MLLFSFESVKMKATSLLTYKRAVDAAVYKDWDDRRYRSRDPRQMPVDGPDDARADTAENRNGPVIRKPRQLHYAC